LLIFTAVATAQKNIEKNKRAANINTYIRVLIDTQAHGLSTNAVYTFIVSTLESNIPLLKK